MERTAYTGGDSIQGIPVPRIKSYMRREMPNCTDPKTGEIMLTLLGDSALDEFNLEYTEEIYELAFDIERAYLRNKRLSNARP
jgi:hypothetical protein